MRIAAGVAFQQDKFKYIADEIRSYNLFPLPDPLGFGFLRRSSACIPAGVPVGEGNLFFVLGMWLRGIVANKGGGARIGNSCIVTPAH